MQFKPRFKYKELSDLSYINFEERIDAPFERILLLCRFKVRDLR